MILTSDVYYKLSDSASKSLIFVLKSINVNLTRTLYDQDLPYVKDILLTDQIATRYEITIEGFVKPGTGMPYSTVTAAVAAIEGLMPTDYSTGSTLKGGDWNGSSWAENTNYPYRYGTGDTKILEGTIRHSWIAGENYLTGEIQCTITLKIGSVY